MTLKQVQIAYCPLQMNASLSLQVDLKTPNRPPAYAFVEFDDPRDARDAVHGRDGYLFGGGAIRVSLHPRCSPACNLTSNSASRAEPSVASISVKNYLVSSLYAGDHSVLL